MVEYQKPITLKSARTIVVQMENYIYKIKDNEGNKGKGFFCHIKYENKNFPVLITSSDIFDR